MKALFKKSLPVTLLLLLVFLTGAWAAPPVPPVPSPARPVNDYAGLLETTDLQRMEAVGLALKKASGADLVVVIVNDLGGYPIEEYALELFRKWGLGDKEKNNGVLLLINKENVLKGQSGRVRIEVGYGLEGAIPDGKAGRILDEYVLPPWSESNYSRGILQGYLALAAAIAEEYELDLAAEQDLAVLEDYQVQDEDDALSVWFILLIIALIIILSIVENKSHRRQRRRNPFDHGGGPSGGPFFGSGGFGSGSGFGGGGFGGFGGGSSGGGGASR